MKEIIRITVGLTISCLIAALVMGSVFAITDKAKKHNEHQNVQDTMLGLLGYGKSNPAPSDLKFHTVYRYVMEKGDNKNLGYLVPVNRQGQQGYALVLIDLQGKFAGLFDLDLSSESAAQVSERNTALRSVLKSPMTFTYEDSTIIAELGKKRLAYLLPGEFPGFKTFIKVMLALDPSFMVIGLDIMEDEEDPGLGAEIGQDYFKNQFQGKSFEVVNKLKVIKEPLPQEYKMYLERKEPNKKTMPEEEIKEIQKKYKDQDIYAITGATISSRCVTDGVKNIARRFAYRLNILDDVLSGQKVPVAF